MQRIQPAHVRFAAQLQVQVPRNAGGTLEDGVVDLLERVETVEVEAVELRGLVPRLNDMAVDVTVHGRMGVDADVEDAQGFVREQLADAFGVAEVEQCRLRQAPEDPQIPVLEYG